MTPEPRKPKLAFWFRYGAAEHSELFHALPDLIESLSRHVEVHYFGLKSNVPLPEKIRRHCVMHELPLKVKRTSGPDKLFKSLCWIALLPFVARTCRKLEMDGVYIDETIPFAAAIARRFYGPNVAITVADFFVDIYMAPYALLRPLAKWIRSYDIRSWVKLPMIITRAKTTQTYLAGFDIDPSRVHPIYDPCDDTVFFPLPHEECRREFGFMADEVILIHHGILHPNKGNDRILRAVARLKDRLPGLRYLLVGDGPDMERLRSLVRELDLEKQVILTGWLPGRGDVNRALNAGNVGLVMRVGHESDNFHMTGALVHAMACGLPVLAARLGGIREVVHEEENGLLFDPECGSEFDDKLIRLYGDATLRRRLGEQALSDAREQFSMSSVITRTTDILVQFTRGGSHE